MATYYVDPVDGDDANTGTDPYEAWGTLAYAFGQVSAGDTVICRGGVNYTEKSTASLSENGTVDSPVTVLFDTNGDHWPTSGDVFIDYGGSVEYAWVVDGSFWDIKQNGSGTITIANTTYGITLNYYAARVRFFVPLVLSKMTIGVYGRQGGYAYFGYLDSDNISTATIVSESHAVSIFISNLVTGSVNLNGGGHVEIVKGNIDSQIKVSWGSLRVWDSGASAASVSISTMVRQNSVHYNDYGFYLGQGYVQKSTDVSSPTGQPDVIKAVFLATESGEGLIPFRWTWIPNTSGNATIHVYIRPSGVNITPKHFILHTIYKSSSTNIWRHESTENLGVTYNADTWTDINYTTSQPVTAGLPITVYGEIPGIPSSAGSSFTIYIDTSFSVEVS